MDGQAVRRTAALTDRLDERSRLTRLVQAVRSGESRALVLRGDPGYGKTALLDFLTDQAAGCRVLRVTGMQSEMELAFAGLHQLCAPNLDRLGRLPAPQQDALRTAFGMSEGPQPDRFLVALAALGLLSEAAEAQPLLCVVDDVQWLDRASAQALGFVARRLGAEPIGLVFASRTSGEELAGLPELLVEGLSPADSRELLDSALTAPLDERVRAQIVAEASGNPLALLEVPRGFTPAQLAGGYGLPATMSHSERIQRSFQRQLGALPPETLKLLQLAAAEPSGRTALVRQAAELLDIRPGASAAAADAGLAEFGLRIQFRHPLLRSLVYRSAKPADQRAAHLALAAVTDPVTDPDRRAWHRAHAAQGPDEEIARELEGSAVRAQARGGLAAAAAFRERSAELTADPAQRTDRTLAAAATHVQAGAFDAARALLATAEAGTLDALQSAQVTLLRGHIAFAATAQYDAVPILTKAAQRFETLHRDTARDTYQFAWIAASYAGGMATGVDLAQVSRLARLLPPPAGPAGYADRLLDALTLMVTDGVGVAAPKLHAVIAEFNGPDISEQEQLQLGWFSQMPASILWDLENYYGILETQVRNARDAGALDRLRFMLYGLVHAASWAGDIATAAELTAELVAIYAATGQPDSSLAQAIVACSRGDEADASGHVELARDFAAKGGVGMSVALIDTMAARLYNGLGRHEEALAVAAEAADDHPGFFTSLWALPELAEAAVRTGDLDRAREALELMTPSVLAGGTDTGLGMLARLTALVSDDDAAEDGYHEAIERLGRTRFRAELGRSHLLYGEWLRTRGRRAEARNALRTAHAILSEIGYAAFAERARRELRAAGERVRSQPVKSVSTLTEQEAVIARLACEGRTNPEIGAQLFLSARTVEWHLRKIYSKLGITTRRELGAALRHTPPPATAD
ncbi:MAG: AAA family ATPase [Catenulispora sp.]|nr:AAA family ATPase [Catenulispora sp.]